MGKDRKKVHPSRKYKRISDKDCPLCYGEGYSVATFGDNVVVLPCACVKEKKIEKTLH